MTKRIDAHHHLWHYSEAEFAWLNSNEFADLRRDFLVENFRSEMQTAQIQGCVAVQARQTLEETSWLLQLARETPEILGVVGWADIAHPEFAATLDPLLQEQLLKGLRHVVQAEPAGFLDNPAFNAGIDRLTGTSLVYDILIVENQLEEATRFVDRHPAQPFVLDHIAKPNIRTGGMEPWARQLHELARRPNVVCKLSGMVTEANPRNWTKQQLEPYFQTVLEAFTPQRILVGSDWPVLLAGCTYAAWWRIVEEWIAPLSTYEQEAMMGKNAARVYGLTAGGGKGSEE